MKPQIHFKHLQKGDREGWCDSGKNQSHWGGGCWDPEALLGGITQCRAQQPSQAATRASS